jgi:hypothetical protein
MHALMPSILLWMAAFDALEANAEAQPLPGEFADA